MTKIILFSVYIFFAALLLSCNNFAKNFFTVQNAREKYETTMKKKDPAALAKWNSAAALSLEQPVPVSAPYKEKTLITKGFTDAVTYQFTIKPGQKISVSLMDSGTSVALFLELYLLKNDSTRKFISIADTSLPFLTYDAVEGGTFLLSAQPTLNATGSYQLSISLNPILQWPIDKAAKSSIISYWGAARDGGARSHEGIDIKAERGSKIVAAADGYIGYVDETNIGGKVVSLRPDGLPISLYHAHMDSQYVQAGQRVKTGDVLGTVGNTGNARNTIPHLHFGIYAPDGAINPLGFVEAVKDVSIKEVKLTGERIELTSKIKLYRSPEKKNVLDTEKKYSVRAVGYTNGFYRVVLDNKVKGFVAERDLK